MMKVNSVLMPTRPLLELCDDDKWEVMREFPVKVIHDDGSAIWVHVPIGFRTDLASVPRIPGAFMLFGDRAKRAGIVHDYLYSTGSDREYADEVFLACMRHEVGDSVSRRVMWLGVRLFGGMFWKPGKGAPTKHPEPVQWPDA
jgi:hypothetical protein